MFWSALAALVSSVGALRRGASRVLPGAYIDHQGCRGPEGGLGARLASYTFMYRAALELNMTLVCRPNNWNAVQHGYSNTAAIIGCTDDAPPMGNQVSLSAVSGLPVSNTALERLHAEAAHLKQNVVYKIPWNTDCGNSGTPLTVAWKWYRQQYHAVRLADPARRSPECWGGGVKSSGPLTRVALQIRRGDNPGRGYPAATYVRILDALFDGSIPGIRAIPSETHIMVISETSWDDPEFLAFDRFRSASKVNFRLGTECSEVQMFENVAHCLGRLVADMDCMTTSDVLLTRHGTFAAAVSALQQTGKSLVMKLDHRTEGLDNELQISNTHKSRNIQYQMSIDMPNQIDVLC
mmetsp:Transcript_122757/g.382178  ORF Transcript_122757/g.382178 Transcript_122757/m.382178 type:complete len:351 (+) Transcript_122757:99-1151(+)